MEYRGGRGETVQVNVASNPGNHGRVLVDVRSYRDYAQSKGLPDTPVRGDVLRERIADGLGLARSKAASSIRDTVLAAQGTSYRIAAGAESGASAIHAGYRLLRRKATRNIRDAFTAVQSAPAYARATPGALMFAATIATGTLMLEEEPHPKEASFSAEPYLPPPAFILR